MRGDRRARPGARAGGEGDHRAGQGLRTLRSAQEGASGPCEAADRAVQIPAHRGLRGRPAQDDERQDTPQRDPPAGRGKGGELTRLTGALHSCGALFLFGGGGRNYMRDKGIIGNNVEF